jgi:hypothetical protein
MDKLVILLSGKKGTGKNTAASIITKILGSENVDEIAFADPIKRFTIDCFGLTTEQCYGTSGERESAATISWENISDKYKPDCVKGFMSVREVLQYVGTNVLRGFYHDIWAHAGKTAAERSNKKIIVFTDTRFPNEIQKLRSLATSNIRVTTVRMERETGRVDNHESETALDKYNQFEYIINNNLGRTKLVDNIRYLLKSEASCRISEPIRSFILEKLNAKQS